MKNLQEIQKAITELSKNDLEVLKNWLEALEPIKQEQKYDPIEKYIGVFDSNSSDWLERHDQYLGQSVLNQETE